MAAGSSNVRAVMLGDGRVLGLVLGLAWAGCAFHPGGGAAGDDDELDASVDAPCVTGCAPAGDEAITCDDAGTATRVPCPFGCIDDATGPVCASTLVPANVDPDALSTFTLMEVAGGIPFEAGFRVAIDSDFGAIYKYPASGPFIGVRNGVQGLSNKMGFERVSDRLSVLAVQELRVVAGSTLEVFGSRALVILSKQDAIIDGRVRADAGICAADTIARRTSCGGAGGGRGGGDLGLQAGGCAPGGNGAVGQLDTGGAGGGMATEGGDGGSSGVAGGDAQAVTSCPGETLVPLAGGGGGGKALGGNGGGGGGALQITAYGTLRLGAEAVVTAVGTGGQGPSVIANTGGGGGGAGGAILLEGAIVDVGSGIVSVAGGGGGGGRVTGADGEAGRPDGQPALGGAGDGSTRTDGLGGNGAIDAIGALAGSSNGAATLDGTGGGGGGLGRIRVDSVRGDAARGPGFIGRYSAGRTTRKR